MYIEINRCLRIITIISCVIRALFAKNRTNGYPYLKVFNSRILSFTRHVQGLLQSLFLNTDVSICADNCKCSANLIKGLNYPSRRSQTKSDGAAISSSCPVTTCPHYSHSELERPLLKWLRNSIGRGNMIVLFFSADMVFNVCR